MSTINTFTRGMNQDAHPKFQPEGTYRYALNSVLEVDSGQLPVVASEAGTTLCQKNWPTGKVLIGHTLTDNDDVVLFFFDPATTRPEHQIGIYNPNTCEYTPIVIDEDLNFSDKYPINALFRVRNGCDRFIYFTDNYNPYRVANISDTSDWVDPTFLTLTSADKILFSRPFTIPTIGLPDSPVKFVIDSGGQLEYGAYSFYVRYLDADSNPTSEWVPFSNYIPIGKGLQVNQDNTLLGGASNNTASPNFANKTNKSITFNVNNLDQRFKYFQLAVIKRTSDSGAVSSVDILFPSPILDVSALYVYTGYTSQVFGQTSIAEILTPRQRIEKVRSHVIQDRRLYLGNHSFTQHDYSKYQRYASKIKVTYITQSVTERNAKFPENYVTLGSVCPDEVYALGIVYIHSDGSTSPAFHIPGRPHNVIELDDLHVNPYIPPDFINWDTDDITGDPNIFNSSKTARWQVYSTASIDTTNSGDPSYQGYLGYYETPTFYPDIETCDGQSYWGSDWYGNPIEPNVTNIRHHRMPAQWMYVGEDPDPATYGQYNISLSLTNLEFPDSDIVGWYLVYGDRSEERTVLDRGFIKPLSWDPTDEAYYYDYPDWDVMYLRYAASNNKIYSFVSPNSLYKGATFGGDYISIEKRLHTSTSTSSDINPGVPNIVAVPEWDNSITANTWIYEYTQFRRPSRLNYRVINSDSIPKYLGTVGNDATISVGNSTYLQSSAGDRVENRSRSSAIGIYELEDYMVELDEITFTDDADHTTNYTNFEFEAFLATAKADRDVFTNLFTITYKKLSPYVINGEYLTSSIVQTGGDMFIPFLDLLETYWNSTEAFAHFATTWVVSDINTEFRYFSNSDVGHFTHYRYPGGYDHKLLANYLSTKYYEPIADVSSFFPEYYELNPAYSYRATDNVYLPIPYDYDYCNECVENYPYRVYYSQLDNEEEVFDNFRIVYANNYSNIEGNTGPITDMFTSFDQMYLATTNAIKRVPTKAQTLQSNENSIYIGTAEVLSLPLINLISTDYALGGLPNFKHRILTEFGVVYADPKSRRIFLLADKLNDLSQVGMRNFFEENGKLFLADQYKALTGEEYPWLHTTTKAGIGYILTYDPRYRRVIIHKKDYEILPQYASSFNTSTTSLGVLWFDGTDFFYNGASGTIKVGLSDTTYFKDKSFTISYSFISNAFPSFHSYFPYYFFNTYKTFYSDGAYRHNDGPFQNYYGYKHPHIIDLVLRQDNMDAKISTNVFYTSKTEEYDPQSLQYKPVDATYTGFVAYNSYQTTGFQALLLKTGPFQTDDTNLAARVAKVDSKYRINNIRDLTISHTQPIWSSDPAFLAGQSYLDKVPNYNNIDLNKSPFTLQRLRDHYLGIRFFFQPQENYRISTDVVSIEYANRNR